MCFFVPAAIALVAAALLAVFLRDTPESVGLPDAETLEGAGPAPEPAPLPSETYPTFLLRRVFSNPFIWIASAANFFVYTIRFAVMDWGPTLLKEAKGADLISATWRVAAFEGAGFLGILLTGWLTDRVLRGRASPTCALSMVLCGLSIFALWRAPAGSPWTDAGLLMCTGFFVYGPQALVAVIVVQRSGKHAAATAVGLTSIFGYGSTVLSGWGLGKLVETRGWDAGFAGLIAAAGVGAGLFLAIFIARGDSTHRDSRERLKRE
jgi:OPA family glycerol-3-phosphate transporter-like MFS transporter/OPA family sugar phosphate sensor protein UhpC-like MFS transporter